MSLTKYLCGAVSAIAVLGLAACGGGGGDGGGGASLPAQRVADVGQTPTLLLNRRLHVGADVAPRILPQVGEHEGTAVSHGRVRDGIGAGRLIAYLQHDVDESVFNNSGHISRFGSTPPTVRVAAGASQEYIEQTVRAVQLINAALPHDWQLKFNPEPRQDDEPFGHGTVWYNGEILIKFSRSNNSSVAGFSRNSYGRESAYGEADIAVASRVSIDPVLGAGEYRLSLIIHELLHSLGRGHAAKDRFRDSITASFPVGLNTVPGHELHPLDREALLAVYGTLHPADTSSDIASKLGPWANTSIHIRGDLDLPGSGAVAFGAALRNGLAQPWAYGPAPSANLHQNDQLSGSATWSGRLLGLTPETEVVAGASRLTVGLQTLRGDLNFTELESWAGRAAPGTVGSGSQWGDGFLNYRIGVRGNAFKRVGGDAGVVTGVFLGSKHEGMGGTLQRDDLTAGFGGKR